MLTTPNPPERSLYRAVHAPYYIYALDYRQQSAGIRALHYLCHALNELGYEAYVSCEVTHPPLRTPRLTNRVKQLHEAAGRTPIVVYPEVIPGNPLNGEIVVRWLLNQPGHLSGDKYFDDRDILFTFDRAFLPPGMRAQVLTFPLADRSIFNNDDNPHDADRQLVCYYANKYLARGGQLTHHVKGAVSLCQDVKLSHRQLADILRQARLLYIYEPTALMTEAQLCGCPVTVIVTEYWKNNINNPNFARGMGVAMDDSAASIDEARRQARARAENYDRSIEMGWGQIARFAEITQRETANRLADRRAAQPPAVPGEAAGATAATLDPAYALWRATHAQGGALVARHAECHAATLQPAFLLLIAQGEWHGPRLASTLDALEAQQGATWRACIVAAHEPPSDFAPRENVRWLDARERSFVAACNRAIAQDGYDWLCLLEAGDTLEPHALALLAAKIALHPQWRLIYADEDNLRLDGGSDRPYFKPDFDLDFLRGAPYALGGGLAMHRELLHQLGGFREAYEGVELYDLLLRAHELAGDGAFGHVADVLYHRHPEGGHQTKNDEEIIALRQDCLNEHLERAGQPADLEAGVLPGTFRIVYRHDGHARVTIIVPTRNGGVFLQRCVGAIVENTQYPHWDLIVVDQGSDDPDTLAFLDVLRGVDPGRVSVLDQGAGASLPMMVNTAARRAQGRYLLLLSDACAPLQKDWLDELLGHALRPDVGVVGAKSIGPDGTLSFAGYVLGLNGRPAGLHDLRASPADPGYFGRLQVAGSPSAVSANCMLTDKTLFLSLEGFDDTALAGGYSDVDYCLRVRQTGRRVVWTPFALLLQEHMSEPDAAADDEEIAVFGGGEAATKSHWHRPTPAAQAMFDHWLPQIAFDPAYNLNLSLAGEAFAIEPAPGISWDPEIRPLTRILGHPGDRSGSGEYRVMAPLRALVAGGRVQGWETSSYLSIPELARMAPDVMVLQRQVKWTQLSMMEEYLRYSSAFRVFELDDLMTNLQIDNEARREYQAKDLVKRFRKALNLCDRFVVSTDYLAEEYRDYASDIRVVPNMLQRATWGALRPRRRQGGKPRVGWAGSRGHGGDLAILADVVKATHEEVDWVFFGMCPEGVRPLVEYHALVRLQDYPAKLASLNLDLALAPLDDVPFNHAKSHLRLLEYGVLGYPVICTDITPYRGDCPVTRVRNRYKEWVDAIREHVADLDELARRGDALRDHIHARWMLEDHLDAWLKAWLP